MLMQAQESKNLASRLLNLKPTVDNKEPKKYSTRPKPKKSKMSDERQRQIDQENSHLLKKMLEIISRKNTSFRSQDSM